MEPATFCKATQISRTLHPVPLVPRLMLLLPARNSSYETVRNAKEWFSGPLRLHFLCAHSFQRVPLYGSGDTDGYPIENPKAFLSDNLVYVMKLTLMVLAQALVTGRANVAEVINRGNTKDYKLLALPVTPQEDDLLTPMIVTMQFMHHIADLQDALNDLFQSSSQQHADLVIFDHFMSNVDGNDKDEIGKMRRTVDGGYVKLAGKMFVVDKGLTRLPMECASGITPEWVWNKYGDEYEAVSVERKTKMKVAKAGLGPRFSSGICK
eukprot:FR735812.1.p1 GENE.FR735812.1~~FR735812.1.p1  ORF type:complete len:266 (+),score=23.75 FR735812.1:114-911(+)